MDNPAFIEFLTTASMKRFIKLSLINKISLILSTVVFNLPYQPSLSLLHALGANNAQHNNSKKTGLCRLCEVLFLHPVKSNK